VLGWRPTRVGVAVHQVADPASGRAARGAAVDRWKPGHVFAGFLDATRRTRHVEPADEVRRVHCVGLGSDPLHLPLPFPLPGGVAASATRGGQARWRSTRRGRCPRVTMPTMRERQPSVWSGGSAMLRESKNPTSCGGTCSDLRWGPKNAPSGCRDEKCAWVRCTWASTPASSARDGRPRTLGGLAHLPARREREGAGERARVGHPG